MNFVENLQLETWICGLGTCQTKHEDLKSRYDYSAHIRFEFWAIRRSSQGIEFIYTCAGQGLLYKFRICPN